MNYTDRTLLVLYATETGTAQDVADQVARHLRSIHFNTRVCSMDTYEVYDLVDEKLVVFVVSTTGSGVEPFAMTSMWNMLLRSDLPLDLFEDMKFVVFGLGDTAYEKFCWPAKKLSRRMVNLGGTEILSRGEGDEQHRFGIEGALDPWKDQLIETLLKLYPLENGMQPPSPSTITPPRISISAAVGVANHERQDPLELDQNYHTMSVICNRRITSNDWNQDVRHIEFSCEHDLEYEPGDAALIHPQAMDCDVEACLTSLGWSSTADDVVEIHHVMEDQSIPRYLPKFSTMRELLTRYVDFNAVPRRSFFQLLRQFSTSELEIEKLNEFLSADGADDLYDYCYRVKRTIKEVLEEFRSAKIPKEYVFDIFPPMRPRYFSIASSVKRHPRQVHLCVALVEYRTKLKIPRRGVCTSFLKTLKTGASLRLAFHKGTLNYPSNKETPVICVGPGTGVAPMRAIIEDRVHCGSSHNTLYFGCRSADKDQHYREEWESLAADGHIFYRVACSRDGPPGIKRTYVQDLISEDSQRIWDLVMNKGAWVLISGSSNKMPMGVKAAITLAIEKHGGIWRDAKGYVEAMEAEGRWFEECWS